jgi:hypothetical protein
VHGLVRYERAWTLQHSCYILAKGKEHPDRPIHPDILSRIYSRGQEEEEEGLMRRDGAGWRGTRRG